MNERLSFIDWMKAIGMALIVWGHTGSDALIRPTEPFNPKQLGVAFFVFVLGFSLARETRPRMQVMFNRLFPIYAVGVSVALLLSAIDWVRVGDLRESNYLPLAFGVNVLFNYFPANPTTWFIGTYTHIIILWALFLARWRITRISLVVIITIEIAARACLMKYAGNFVAYMLLTNWMAVFVLGLYFGQRELVVSQPRTRNAVVAGTTISFIVFWIFVTGRIDIADGFPFAIITSSTETVSLLLTSAAISGLYVTITLLIYRGTLGLPNPGFIQFLARNTLFVFIVHMPLIYALAPVYYPLVPSKLIRIPINLILFFLLPAAVSEVLFKWVDLKRLRDSLYLHLLGWFRPESSHALSHD
jgi:hypothetical protein